MTIKNITQPYTIGLNTNDILYIYIYTSLMSTTSLSAIMLTFPA